MKVVVAGRMGEDDVASLRAASGGALLRVVEGRDGVLREIADAEVYVPGPWDEGILTAGTRLRWVHFLWAGLESQLFQAAVRSSVIITNSAGVFAIPMAEHALALMLAFARGLHFCARRGPGQLWHGEGARNGLTSQMTELNGATLGIVGYGEVGRAAARRAQAFGMRVLAVGFAPRRGDGVAQAVWGPERLGDLLRESDYVLISCALTPATRGLIGQEELALMKPHAVLINVARGAVVQELALVETLRAGRVRGAGLDATAEEPLPLDSPLWQMENVLITPHVSGASPQTRPRQMALLRENLRRYAAGEPLLNVVDKAAGY